MSKIMLTNGVILTDNGQLKDIPPVKTVRMAPLEGMAAQLKEMREGWEAIIPQPENVHVPLLLVLADMAGLIGLTEDETREALGERLCSLLEAESM